MFLPDQINSLAKQIMAQLGGGEGEKKTNSIDEDSSKCSNKNKLQITPTQALIIAGILGGVLDVSSVLVDRNQVVQIILEGSLRRKTELEEMMDEIGQKPFDEVLKAMLDRF